MDQSNWLIAKEKKKNPKEKKSWTCEDPPTN
jgi:hypothetical protein